MEIPDFGRARENEPEAAEQRKSESIKCNVPSGAGYVQGGYRFESRRGVILCLNVQRVLLLKTAAAIICGIVISVIVIMIHHLSLRIPLGVTWSGYGC
jgi:hypothetical protein